jgi:Sensors of blue-light using FAD
MSQHTDLHRLIYHSRNRLPGERADVAAEIEAILAASRRNNAAAGITGALIFNNGIFAQVLEGPLAVLERTFERIQCDPRHGEVQVLAFEAVAERSFPSWSMGFVGQSGDAKNLFAHIGAATGFEDRRLEGERVLSIMRAIAIDEEVAGSPA